MFVAWKDRGKCNKKGDCLEKINFMWPLPEKYHFSQNFTHIYPTHTRQKTNEMKNQLLLCWKKKENKLGKKNGDKI